MDQTDLKTEQVREQHAESERPVQRRRRKGRPLRATARFDDEEWETVCTAATGAGLTPRGWLAAAGVAAAEGKPPPRWRVVEPQLVELAATRKQLVRVGTLLNQATKATNATGMPSVALAALAGRVEVLVAELDRLTAAIMGRSL